MHARSALTRPRCLSADNHGSLDADERATRRTATAVSTGNAAAMVAIARLPMRWRGNRGAESDERGRAVGRIGRVSGKFELARLGATPAARRCWRIRGRSYAATQPSRSVRDHATRSASPRPRQRHSPMSTGSSSRWRPGFCASSTARWTLQGRVLIAATKADLVTEKDGTIPCLFNPTEISVQKSNSVAGRRSRGRNAPKQRFQAGQPATIGLSLMLDTSLTGTPVTAHTDKLFGLLKVDPSLPGADGRASPPAVGQAPSGGRRTAFKAVVERLSVNFTYFAATGLRCGPAPTSA